MFFRFKINILQENKKMWLTSLLNEFKRIHSWILHKISILKLMNMNF